MDAAGVEGDAFEAAAGFNGSRIIISDANFFWANLQSRPESQRLDLKLPVMMLRSSPLASRISSVLFIASGLQPKLAAAAARAGEKRRLD